MNFSSFSGIETEVPCGEFSWRDYINDDIKAYSNVPFYEIPMATMKREEEASPYLTSGTQFGENKLLSDYNNLQYSSASLNSTLSGVPKLDNIQSQQPNYSNYPRESILHPYYSNWNSNINDRMFTPNMNFMPFSTTDLSLRPEYANFQYHIPNPIWTDTNATMRTNMNISYHIPSDLVADRPFACYFDGCCKRYKKKSHLKTHIRIHTHEKPFICEWDGCPWKFARSDELTRHFRRHTKEKPYECKECGKKFARSDHLGAHKKRH